MFEAKKVCKNPRPGGQRLFSPKHSDYQKSRKYIDPSPLAIPKWPLGRVLAKRDPQKPRGTNEQPRHEIEEATSGQSNEGMTIPRWRRELKRKRNPLKTQRQKTKDANKKKQRIQRMQAQKTNWTERRFCSKHQKQQLKNKKESLTPSNIFQEHQTKTCSVDERNPPKKPWFCERTLVQSSPKGQQNEIIVVSIVFFVKCARGAWGEEKHKMRKRRNKDNNHSSKNNQTRYTQRNRKKRGKKTTQVIKKRTHKRRKTNRRKKTTIKRCSPKKNDNWKKNNKTKCKKKKRMMKDQHKKKQTQPSKTQKKCPEPW